MSARHSSRRRRQQLLLAWVLIVVGTVEARNNRRPRRSPAPSESPSFLPSEMPSLAPSDTAIPSTYPSLEPSETGAPSDIPSHMPSNIPTETISSFPSSVPSAQPSSVMIPSASPTTTPTEPPTEATPLPTTSPPSSPPPTTPTDPPAAEATPPPTTSPPSTPSPVPAPSPLPTTMSPDSAVSDEEIEGSMEVVFPDITVSFSLADTDVNRAALGEAEMLASMTTFFEQAISSSLTEFSFQSLELEVDVSVAQTQRSLSDFVMVQILGEAIFDETPVPTTEELREILRQYFSRWGGRDLEIHLENSGLWSIEGLEVAIDGVVVGSTQGAGGSSPPTTPAGGERQIEDSEDNSISTGLIAGLVVGITAMFVAGLLVLAQKRKQNNQKRERESQVSGTQTRIGASPRGNAPNTDPLEDLDADASYAGVLSLEDSLFTTDTETPYAPPSAVLNQYDAKRLDRVIDSAKGFVKEHDDVDQYVI